MTKLIKKLFKQGKSRATAILEVMEFYGLSEAQALLLVNEIYDEMEK